MDSRRTRPGRSSSESSDSVIIAGAEARKAANGDAVSESPLLSIAALYGFEITTTACVDPVASDCRPSDVGRAAATLCRGFNSTTTAAECVDPSNLSPLVTGVCENCVAAAPAVADRATDPAGRAEFDFDLFPRTKGMTKQNPTRRHNPNATATAMAIPATATGGRGAESAGDRFAGTLVMLGAVAGLEVELAVVGVEVTESVAAIDSEITLDNSGEPDGSPDCDAELDCDADRDSAGDIDATELGDCEADLDGTKEDDAGFDCDTELV